MAAQASDQSCLVTMLAMRTGGEARDLDLIDEQAEVVAELVTTAVEGERVEMRGGEVEGQKDSDVHGVGDIEAAQVEVVAEV